LNFHNKILPKFDKTIWNDFLSLLNYENSIIILKSNNFKKSTKIQLLDQSTIQQKIEKIIEYD